MSEWKQALVRPGPGLFRGGSWTSEHGSRCRLVLVLVSSKGQSACARRLRILVFAAICQQKSRSWLVGRQPLLHRRTSPTASSGHPGVGDSCAGGGRVLVPFVVCLHGRGVRAEGFAAPETLLPRSERLGRGRLLRGSLCVFQSLPCRPPPPTGPRNPARRPPMLRAPRRPKVGLPLPLLPPAAPPCLQPVLSRAWATVPRPPGAVLQLHPLPPSRGLRAVLAGRFAGRGHGRRAHARSAEPLSPSHHPPTATSEVTPALLRGPPEPRQPFV